MKVGDYVRYITGLKNTTKIRKINKIIPPDEFIKENYYYFNMYEGTIEKNIIKSSPNIIDLIEVGDYVNGFEVLRIDKECDLYPKTLKCQYRNNTDYFDIFNENIRTIVTKEQFENCMYKVGD